jgi:hypothetical protein
MTPTTLTLGILADVVILSAMFVAGYFVARWRYRKRGGS